MELPKMPAKLFTKKLLNTTDRVEEAEIERLLATNPQVKSIYSDMQKIWEESVHLQNFSRIDAIADWEIFCEKVTPMFPARYHRQSLGKYFLRIAALIIFTAGLSAGLYKLITTLNSNESSDFVTYNAVSQIENIVLPDGSSIALNSGSSLTYRDGFGTTSRELILTGEAFFDVMHGHPLPFKVYVGESLVEVTGTSFSVYEKQGIVNVSVISGTVVLASKDSLQKRININANQSGCLLQNKELRMTEGVPVNVLSWKTGHLVFEQTPIDSALMDIAHHFRKDLSIEASLNEKITAEFQDQPLREILDELNLVAGLRFDTTGTALIVRR
jgi:transmembrane sensor